MEEQKKLLNEPTDNINNKNTKDKKEDVVLTDEQATKLKNQLRTISRLFYWFMGIVIFSTILCITSFVFKSLEYFDSSFLKYLFISIAIICLIAIIVLAVIIIKHKNKLKKLYDEFII